MQLFRLVLLPLAVALSACGHEEPVNAAAVESEPRTAPAIHSTEQVQANGYTDCTVELNGDSVLFGFSHLAYNELGLQVVVRHEPTPAQWLRNHGYTVVDKTAGGLRTYDLRRGYTIPFEGADAWPALYPNGAQLPFNQIVHSSRIIVLQTGINDFRTVPFNVEQVKDDYRYMVDYIRSLGKIPVIAGNTNVSTSVDPDSYAKMKLIRDAVRAVAAEKSVHFASFDAIPLAWIDGIHLDQASSNGIAENLRYVLSVICGNPF